MPQGIKKVKRRKKRPDWMRPQVLGSVLILVVLVASLFTFLIPQGGNDQATGETRDLQLNFESMGFTDVLSILPSGVEDFLYTDFSNQTGEELRYWAAASTGAPDEKMLGRQAMWFANANYPHTQGSSSFEIIEHWVLMMSVGNATIYEYPNVQSPYSGINITRHPNFYYTPNTDPVIITAVESDLFEIVDIWMGTNESANEMAIQEHAVLLRDIPDTANWIFFNEYWNTTSPLNYSDMVCAAITTLGDGEYFFNISTHLKYYGQPNASLFTTPVNATGNATFYVNGEYAYYGLRAELEVIIKEAVRLGIFG